MLSRNLLVACALAFCCAANCLTIAASQADDCLSKPNAPSPQGTHWYYRIDRATQRHCWYLGAEGRESTRAGARDRLRQPPGRREGALTANRGGECRAGGGRAPSGADPRKGDHKGRSRTRRRPRICRSGTLVHPMVGHAKNGQCHQLRATGGEQQLCQRAVGNGRTR